MTSIITDIADMINIDPSIVIKVLRIIKTKNVKIAYPHLEIVGGK